MMSCGSMRLASAAAIADRDLAAAVARHKGMFLSEKAADRTTIHYVAAIGRQMRLVPTAEALRALEEILRHGGGWTSVR
jgi:hypothetical protein